MPFKNTEAKREYQRQLMAKRRAEIKGLKNVSPSFVNPVSPNSIMLDPVRPKMEKLDPSPSVSPKLDPQLVSPEPEKLVPIEKVRPSIPKLWANYYRTKKPYCWRCDYSGIQETEYQYCSEAKLYNPTFKKYFDQCLIKHWEKHNQTERT